VSRTALFLLLKILIFTFICFIILLIFYPINNPVKQEIKSELIIGDSLTVKRLHESNPKLDSTREYME
jgi:hypothetical protein